MKKVMLLLVLAMFVVPMIVVSDCSAATPRPWKLSHTRPVGNVLDVDVVSMVEQIKRDSDGRINIETYPASQLGDYTTVHERVSIGDVEMQFGPISVQANKKLGINLFPYLVKNWDEAEFLFGKGGLVRGMIADMLKDQDIELISVWPAFFGGIGTTVEPTDPANPSVPKGVKIRVIPTKAFDLTVQALGYQSTPLPWAEIFTAMQTGIVKGVIGAGAESYYANFRDLLKYYMATNEHFESFFFTVNKPLWDSLSAEDRAIIQKAADDLEVKRWQSAQKDDAIFKKKLADHGIKIIEFSDEQISVFRNIVVETVWPKVTHEVPEEMLNQVLDALKNRS